MSTYAQKLTIESATGISMGSKVFRVLLIMFCLLCASYLFFVGNITFSIVAKKSMENEARTIKSEIGALELKYIEASNNVTLELAQSLGYTEAGKIHFAKTSGENALTLR